GEKLVVLVGSEEAILRTGKLQTHQQRQHATQNKKDESGHHEASADAGVMNFRKPSEKTRRLSPRPLQSRVLRGSWRRYYGRFDDGHSSSYCRLRRYVTSAFRSAGGSGFAGIF